MTHPHQHTSASEALTMTHIAAVIRNPKLQISLSEAAVRSLLRCREYLDDKLKVSTSPIYGINTGFGAMAKVGISKENLENLQYNLIRSHACGMGEEVPESVVRLMILLKIKALSKGYSGTSVETVQRLVDFFNHGIHPVIYTQGSLGASGDLAPLAHMSMALIGEGEVNYKGKRRPTAEVLQELGWEPIKLQSKEGLALLNGTQFMQAYGLYLLFESRKYWRFANRIAALSLDAFLCKTDPFDPLLHNVRPHAGQQESARAIRNFLQDSPLTAQPKVQVQDPYSFRCIPQVHGASYDALRYAESVFITEANAVTDNPIIFVEEDQILSGGNFHGQPLALQLDFMAIAIAELGSISERRLYLLLSGWRDLPPFLVPEPGLHSGLMISQYTAAGIVSQNKQFCTPCSVDTIRSSNGQEDHVSMGANAAVKCWKVMDNVKSLLGIELMAASQALHFRSPATTSPQQEQFLADFREVVPVLEGDRYLSPDMHAAKDFLQNYWK